MPLKDCSRKKGKAKKECIGDNISAEIRAGRPRKQAIAIGLSTGRKGKRKK